MARVRAFIGAELTIAFMVPLIAGFLFVAAPDWSGGFWDPPMLAQLLPWAGVGLMIVGRVWMVRVPRIDPEVGERTWRYRDF